MQFAYTVCAYALGLSLDILVIAALLRGGYRRFPFLLMYVVVDLLTSVVELRPVAALFSLATPDAQKVWDSIYWWNERILQVLVFLIVISLVYGASMHLRLRRTLLLALVSIIVAFAAVTFAAHFDPGVRTRVWMTGWTRDLNFGASILDLGLWLVLISRREKDTTILMVAAGLGIQFTGGAIGQAFRGMSRTEAIVMGDLMYLTNLACLYIWWQAFRQRPKRHRPPTAVNTTLPGAANK
jgi:hypothetical protein